MMSGYRRPSSRSPAFVDLSQQDEEEPTKQEQEAVKVSFADPDQASPRSCANPIFLAMMDNASRIKNDADNNNREELLSNNGNGPHEEDVQEQEETPAEVAMLLASVADIACKEIQSDPPIMIALADAFPRFPDLSSSLSDASGHNGSIAPRAEEMDIEEEEQPKEEDSVPALMHFDHKKTRAVSMDETALRAFRKMPMVPPPSPPHEDEAIPTLLQWRNLRGQSTSPPHHHGIFSTPPASPMISSRKHAVMHNSDFGRSSSLGMAKAPRGRPRSVSLAEGSAIKQVPMLNFAAPEGGVNDKPKKLILRKKFSWKNYPELEEFLIANREEYLRHSTLNYTMQQKKYNNCLTERMVKLASEHGYMFDETEFSFVTVRDRIRCYYKSYVQSMKKRGVVIGYAARKAGLVTEAELEQSAHTSGKIYVPRN